MILAALAGYSAVASYGTPFGRMGLDGWFDTRCARVGLAGGKYWWGSGIVGWGYLYLWNGRFDRSTL